MAKQSFTKDDAEACALKALAFLASDAARLTRFLGLTGMEPGDLRANAGEEATLTAVLDHLLADQSLLLVFSADAGIQPEQVELARVLLAGHGSQGVWL